MQGRKGELTENSEIDLLLIFDVPHNPETGGELEKAHRILGEIKTQRKLQIVAKGYMVATKIKGKEYKSEKAGMLEAL
ncbi:nucleotidyltransferase domain-containing protein [Candidatus Bathyarchaeota archaeon]|nr:nucleotidyltransferase domain-containing protein [Candidatus Bathyarchaeota archaeon]